MSNSLAQNRTDRVNNLCKMLMDLPQGSSTQPAQEDLAMLSIMVSAAYQGIDLASHYPTFYGKLETNNQLREHFLDALDLMTHTDAGTLAPLPGPPSHDLSFLQKTRVNPALEQRSWQEWCIIWRQTVRQIQQCFSPPEMVYRGEDEWYENSWILLLRDQVQVNDWSMQIVLEATANEEGDDYSPLLTVIPTDKTMTLPLLLATLHWGDYRENVTVDTRGHATFPPIPITNFYDPAHNLIIADLQLSLEPIPVSQ